MSTNAKTKLLVSLHDVTPVHRQRLERAERLIADLGIRKCAYLLVPRFHHTESAAESEWFRGFCLKQREFEVEWLLHGFFHREGPSDRGRQKPTSKRDALKQWWKREFMTGGEGEFLSLSTGELKNRLEQGSRVFSDCLNRSPQGFVAPAWLYNERLVPALKELGFHFTENHRSVIDLAPERSIRAPVITWATRTVARKYSSILGCPLLLKAWRKESVLRVAMHPHDFDHPETTRNVSNVLKRALAAREAISYRELITA